MTDKKQKEPLRDISLLIRLQSAEKSAFQEAASLAGVPLSAWIRERLRSAAAKELREKAGRMAEFLKLD
jgi:hypothetical protein